MTPSFLPPRTTFDVFEVKSVYMPNDFVYSQFFLVIILRYIQDYMTKSGGLTRYTLPRVTRQSLVCCRLSSALDAIANYGGRNERFSRPLRVEIVTFSDSLYNL